MANLQGVEDTLYIPLVSRIYSSEIFPEYFSDKKSVELEQYIPQSHKIKEASKEYAVLAAVARCYNFDKVVNSFIAKHDKCNIINLGAGLETLYFRVNNTSAMFYELDFPNVIEIRRKLIGENPNEILIGGDILNLEWIQKTDTSLPTLFLASGVFQYFKEDVLISFIHNLQQNYPKGELMFDCTDKTGLKVINRYVRKTGNTSAMMYFYVNNVQEFAAKSNTTLITCLPFYTDAKKILRNKLSLITKILISLADWTGKSKLLHLRLNN